ncbi:MAG: 4-(cytidine 5'-diphospho)-2-C-methyl-D-erythritol kinase, partial [Oscillospiraceae bacterium]|nr:4-(cytidine 5'-diphospho)-2-C-methyl-D-erythritol kinase [Oscillospiraceae bacterium]
SIDLADEVTVAESSEPGFHISTSLPYLPRGEGNIAHKAAGRFFEETGLSPAGLAIDIRKHIPVCAGMAGGSSDGAAVLRVLRRMYAPHLPEAKLEEIAALVGSDVPYCVRGGTVLTEGRGERLTDLPGLPPCWFVVCKPAFSVSTPELFAQVRVKKLRCHPDTAGLLSALEQGDLEGIARRMYNVFEDVLPRKYAPVFEIKSALLELGAMAASMTGSGPTVFGLFQDQEAASTAAEALTPQYPSVSVCRPIGKNF